MENLMEVKLKEESNNDTVEYLEKWEDYYPEQSNKILKTIKLFHKEKTKEDYVKALCLWNFIQKYLDSHNKMPTRRSFLKNFIDEGSNTLLSFVATIESLPTSVFRKVLWKYNIDFMTTESFLRRIESEQEEAVVRNYQQLFEKNKVPEVFGWFEKTFKRISVEKLLEEKLNFSTRYERKGAMSYNLLNLDFGFNAYPKGCDDDYKLIEVSPFRFLSEKNHADDFIVNKDFGKYWWLYEKARSNYVWGRYKNVQLKKHICPGFWITFFLHFIFWIASPLFFVFLRDIFLAIHMLDLNVFEKVFMFIPVFLLAIITPIWCAIAILKLIYETHEKNYYNSSIVKKISKFLDKTGKKLAEYDQFFSTLMGIFIFSLVLLFVLGINHLLFKGLFPAFGIWANLVIIFWINFALAEQIFLNNTESKVKSFKHHSKLFRFITIPIVAYLLFRFFVYYEESIYSTMGTIMGAALSFIFVMTGSTLSLIKKIWFIISSFGVLNIYWILPLAVLLVFWIFRYSPKAYSICSKIMYGYCFAVYLHFFLTIGYPLARNDANFMNILLLPTTLTLAPFLILAIIYILYFYYQNPKYEESAIIVLKAKNKNDLHLPTIGDKESKILLKNEWLQKQDKKYQIEIIAKMFTASTKIFGEEKASLGYKLMAEKFTASSLSQILGRMDWIKKQEPELKIELLRLIINGENCNKDTLRKARKILMKKREKRKAIIMLFKIIFSPIYLIFKVLQKVFFEYPKTIYKLYELFNKRCPYVAESGHINSTKL